MHHHHAPERVAEEERAIEMVRRLMAKPVVPRGRALRKDNVTFATAP